MHPICARSNGCHGVCVTAQNSVVVLTGYCSELLLAKFADGEDAGGIDGKLQEEGDDEWW